MSRLTAIWLIVAATLTISDAQAADPAPAPQQLRFDRRSPVVAAVERVKDAVVNISSTRLMKVRYGLLDDELFDRYFGGRDPLGRTVQTTSLGSGVVIHPAGYVLTNAHVVARATEITCSFGPAEAMGESGKDSKDGKLTARLISADPARDLAVLKLNSPKPLPYIPTGRSHDLMIGETVIAIGNAMGYSHSVTTGVVSAVNRKIQLSDELSLDGLIQTDASINPGNSGGPLLNVNGELIGINTAIRGDAQNIGFAIPIDAARTELAFLLDFARVNDLQFGATLGEQLATASPDARSALTVREVAAKSPAAEGGLLPGDVIVSVDDKPCQSLLDFNVTMMDKSAGRTCRFAVTRKDKAVTVKVQLTASPKPDGNELLWAKFGMKARPMDLDTARQYRLPAGTGLVVTQMSEDSQVSRVGIQVGDVLIQVDKLVVSTLDEVGQALKKAQPGDVASLGFLRGRYQIWVKAKAK